jgi:hypothetical protein
MRTIKPDVTPVDLVQYADGVLDALIASMSPDEFEVLLERLDCLPEPADVLREGVDVVGRLGW